MYLFLSSSSTGGATKSVATQLGMPMLYNQSCLMYRKKTQQERSQDAPVHLSVHYHQATLEPHTLRQTHDPVAPKD
jgi:hypothetical protein